VQPDHRVEDDAPAKTEVAVKLEHGER
jgi:hypothetical protein